MVNHPLIQPTLEEIHVELAKLQLERKKLYYGILFDIIVFLAFTLLPIAVYFTISYFQQAHVASHSMNASIYTNDTSYTSVTNQSKSHMVNLNPLPIGPSILFDMSPIDNFMNFMMVMFYIGVIFMYLPFDIKSKWESIQALNIDILQLHEQEETIMADPTASSVTRSFFKELVGLNLKNLDAYYDLTKDHTQKSFLVSISSGIVGFILIIWGLYIGFEDKNNLDNYLAYLSAASGIIMEFIASIFFYLYNKTVRELKGYHNSLLDVQNVLLSFNIGSTATNLKPWHYDGSTWTNLAPDLSNFSNSQINAIGYNSTSGLWMIGGSELSAIIAV